MRILLLLALTALHAPAALAQQTVTGQSESGAFYTISAPDDWVAGDDLAIYNHGFDLGSIEVEPDLGVLGDFLLERGYAVAASSYSLNGWALFQTTRDNRELYAAVAEAFGEPGQVFVIGGSLGALVTMQAVEAGGIGNVAGAYPLCGPLGGSDVWDQALDLRLIYDVVCAGTDGELPGGAEGLPFALDPDDFDGILGEITAGILGAAVLSCTGLGLPEILRSDGQQARLDRLIEATGISEDFLPINLGYATVVLSDLVHDPAKLDGRSALGNTHVDYGDPNLDAAIARVEADPFDRLFFRRSYTPNGFVGATKVLMTHTDKDDLVFPEHQHAYLQRIAPEQVVAATVIDEEPGHCQYSEAEVVAGFEALEAWVATDDQPDVTAIQDRCEAIVADERYEGPCRYDPTYLAAPLESRIRPRAVAEQAVDGLMSGSFFIRGRGGQGWFVEVLTDGRAVVYWFTYDPAGNPAWIGGTGVAVKNGLAIDESWRGIGARFGDGFDPDDVTLDPWGKLEFVFSERGIGEMRYAGPEGWGAGRTAIEQLTRIGAGACGAPFADLSGLWFDAGSIGEGLIFEVQADGRIFAAWFTYDTAGNQLWLYGEATSVGDDTVVIALSRFAGPVFGEGYDVDDLAGEAWGTISLTRNGDGYAMAYAADDAAFGAGSRALTRLTRPLASGDCGSAVP